MGKASWRAVGLQTAGCVPLARSRADAHAIGGAIYSRPGPRARGIDRLFRARAERPCGPFWHPTCSDLLRVHRDNEVPNVASRLEFRAHAPVDDRRGWNPERNRVVGDGIRRRQGHVPHELVRAGRAWRVLPGQGDRALREGRARRHAQDGRSPGQRRAAAARRRDRLHDGLRSPGPQDARTGAAGHHRRDLVPVRSARHHGPRQRREPRRSQGQDDPGGDAGPHDLVAMAEGEIQVYRRADQALHVQPAALLRRQERGAAVLSLVGTVPGQTARGARQVLPVRAGRLSALRHDHGHDPRLRRQESGGDRALRQGVARRVEELSDRSRAGKCAHQGRQSQDERRADRLRTSSNCARSRCWTAATPRPWGSGSSRKRGGKRPTISWSRPACSSPRSTGNRGSPTGS